MKPIEFDAWQRLNWSLVPVFVMGIQGGVAALTAQAASVPSLLAVSAVSGFAGSALGFGLRSAFGMAARVVANDDGLLVKPLGLHEIALEWQDVLALSIHHYDRVHDLHRLEIDVATPGGGAAYSVIGKRLDEVQPFLKYVAIQVRRSHRVATLGPMLTARSRFVLRQAGAMVLGLGACAIPAFLWNPAGGFTALPLGCMIACAVAVAVSSRVRLREWRAYHDGRTWHRGVPDAAAKRDADSAMPAPAHAAASAEVVPQPLRLYAAALVEAFAVAPVRRNSESR